MIYAMRAAIFLKIFNSFTVSLLLTSNTIDHYNHNINYLIEFVMDVERSLGLISMEGRVSLR
jgi:hypothetical protein